METNLEGLLTITKDGELIAVVYNDIKRRAQIFYSCKAMGTDDIKELLESLKTLAK